ncbi:hypothetical protein CH063_02658 [Colletotrichum higginsianum]|uniref:Uncharacterized protein n=1 Tax=Colletotrichum higginsianum (strain IMI 349063) TaxID=759273 RepID=H1VNA5_COLHI|nr:hypothetical protein CH63R_04698 [Colletotrichum higginsianum IMI 349063]OBR12402.1 hypothetical protein CH63R_04698 [Colletotrichum higginsianum IMI 349063]CCF41709.1 hypothetical protein CH063_02658 [Colletotrichum higginsianum]
MSGSETETFPLESVTNAQLQQLGEALWGWKPRSNGTTSQYGVVTTHLRPDLTKFGPYFQYYREMTASYISDAFPPEEIKALRCHDDLFAIINLIRSIPDMQRSELTTKYFSSRENFEETPPGDKQRAFNLAMRAMMMISLKNDQADDQRCILPRQLALETLDSLQKVLFPPDKDSRALLRSLVSKASFDPDCLCLSSVSYRSNDERDLSYHYWGSRLMDLYDELENPRPRGLIDIWLEQRSKARHVMLATLVGVIIAVILGMLGLVVGIFQAWVAYQAWKHPVNV